MRTIWHSLAWKEWHEHKWKLAALAATLCGVATVLMFETHRDMLLGVRVALVLCMVPLAIFIGLSSAAGERSRGTLPFIQALPIPMWRVAFNKIVFGLITAIVPALLALTFIYIWCKLLDLRGIDYSNTVQFSEHGGIPFTFGFENWIVDTGLVLSVIAASFYIWAAAGGVNRKDEISAGAVALIVMVMWSVVIYCGVHYLLVREHQYWSAAVAVATVPGGLVTTVQMSWQYGQNALGIGILAAAVTHLVLVAWYIQRFGRVANLEIRSPQIAARSADRNAWLAPPRRSALSAIAWKQSRESGPIVLAGLAGIIGIVAVFFASDWLEHGSELPRIGEAYTAVAVTLGFVMALVIGIGVCFYDASPQMNTFWRSRPINPDSWFWCKYVTGLGVLLTAIYSPIFLIAALGDTSGVNKANYPEAVVIPVAQIALFAAAVATTCLVRHAVYAAILSMAVVYLGTMAGILLCYVAGLLHLVPPSEYPWLNPTDAQVAFGMTLSFVISTIVAWLAMRYDWGRKSRY